MAPEGNDETRKNVLKHDQPADGAQPLANLHQPPDAESTDSAADAPVQQDFTRREDEAASLTQGISIGDLVREDADALPPAGSPGPGVLPSDVADLSDPIFDFQASTLPGDDPAEAVPAEGTGLSDEKADELIKAIKNELAGADSSGQDASPDKVTGLVLRVVKAAEDGDASDAAAEDANRPVEAQPPRVDHAPGEADRFAGSPVVPAPLASGASPGENQSDALPRIIVMVELANARAVMEADRRETAEEMAAMQKQIAKEEVKEAFWIRDNNRRAADYRLRGPG